MEIALDLSRHCIATELKRLLNAALYKYYANGNADELEERIECLQSALEQLDLPALRGRYPELAGGDDAQVILACTPDNGLRLMLGANPVELIFKITP